MSPPAKPQKPMEAPKPTGAKALSDEDIQTLIGHMNRYMHMQRELGKAERDWHKAAMAFYDAEAEIKRFETEMMKKYDIKPDEMFDPTSGRIVKRR